MAIKDILIIIAVTAIWGLNFSVTKFGMEYVPPLFLNALRFTVVALMAFVIPRPSVDWRIFAGIGVFIGVIKFSLVFVGIKLGLGAGLSSVVIQGQVFFTIILAFLLYKERVQIYQVIGLLIGFAGLFVMSFDDGGDFNLLGFALTVLGSLMWGIANMFFRRTGSTEAVAVIVWASVVALIPLWLLSAFFDGPDVIMQSFQNFNLQVIFVVLFASIFSTVFAYSMWGKMLSKYPAADVTPFALLIPVSGLLGGVFIVNETISVIAMIGIIIIMIGLAVSILGGRVRRYLGS
jgi:O-acetylserine/cysteine efflux transporter